MTFPATAADWFALARKFITFALGVAIIIDAVISAHNGVTEYIIGAVLMGIVPVEEILTVRRRPAIGHDGGITPRREG